MNESPRPLDGLLVVDLTTALSGPYATLLLAGLGARVVKVEDGQRGGDSSRTNSPFISSTGKLIIERENDDDWSVSQLNRARNKESVGINLKDPDGLAVFKKLVERADVLIENFSDGVTSRLGIDYETVRRWNPRIIYTSISGFGQGSAAGEAKAVDLIIQALSGLMMTSGTEGEPPVRVGLPLGDLIAPLYAVIGTLAAVAGREKSGLGSHVDVGMLGALTSLMANEPLDTLERVGIPVRSGTTVPRLSVFGIFESTDGWVAICAHTDHLAARLYSAMGRDELAHDSPFSRREGRVVGADTIHAIVSDWVRGLSTADVVARLTERGVPVAMVETPAVALQSPIVRSRKEVVPLLHPNLGQLDYVSSSGVPILFDGVSPELNSPAERLGESTQSVFHELLGITQHDFETLKDAGAIY
jgi:crotonobetainyl-CoA:carnitine CoA-transferase CaiB-like acyl-CoA transferase